MIKTHGIGQSGQVGLVVLLVGAVLMTIGLGVASQSVMEINTANLETDSSQAFNAAEQGIEAALQNSFYQSGEGETISGYNVNVQITPQVDNYQGTILSGHSAQLDMQGVTNLELTWSDPGCGDGHAAIVVTLIGFGGQTWSRQAYGRNCTVDNFSEAICIGESCSVTPDLGGLSYAYARIKSVYSDTQLTAALTGSSATQYYEITSTATRPDSGEARSVQVSKSAASVPSIFDYALFSGVDLAP